MTRQRLETDVLIIGGGLAGIAAALELLERGRRVLILDRDEESRFGGLAKDAFGGMALSGTPLQKLNGIRDDADLLLRDWLSFADFAPALKQGLFLVPRLGELDRGEDESP